jgi:hypothetical protein
VSAFDAGRLKALDAAEVKAERGERRSLLVVKLGLCIRLTERHRGGSAMLKPVEPGARD